MNEFNFILRNQLIYSKMYQDLNNTTTLFTFSRARIQVNGFSKFIQSVIVREQAPELARIEL